MVVTLPSKFSTTKPQVVGRDAGRTLLVQNDWDAKNSNAIHNF